MSRIWPVARLLLALLCALVVLTGVWRGGGWS